MQRTRDFLLFTHVKTSNAVISHCCVADGHTGLFRKCVPHKQRAFFTTFNQSNTSSSMLHLRHARLYKQTPFASGKNDSVTETILYTEESRLFIFPCEVYFFYYRVTKTRFKESAF